MIGYPVWINISTIFVIANILFHIIYLMDRRTKSEGVLFSQPASLKSRVYSALLGVIFSVFFIVLWALGFRKSELTIFPAIAAIALFGYCLGIDKPLQQIQNVEMFNHFAKRKKIIGVEGKTIDQIISMARVGGKFVVFEYCISPLIVTIDYDSNIHFLEPNEENPNNLKLRYSIISLLFGWESLFGLIHTIRCIAINFRGGKDITQQVINWLQQMKEKNE